MKRVMRDPLGVPLKGSIGFDRFYKGIGCRAYIAVLHVVASIL